MRPGFSSPADPQEQRGDPESRFIPTARVCFMCLSSLNRPGVRFRTLCLLRATFKCIQRIPDLSSS